MNESSGGSSTPPVHIEFESFVSPLHKSTTLTSSRSQHLTSHSTDQLIIYAAPIIQSQLSSRSKEIAERLKEVKKDKTALLAIMNKAPMPKPAQQHEDQQQ